MVAPIERAFKHSQLLAIQKESIRHLIANTVDFNSKFAKPNLSLPHILAVKAFCSNPSIVITNGDKRGQIAVLGKSTYLEKSQDPISEVPCVEICKYPSTTDLNNIKSVVKTCSILSDKMKKFDSFCGSL